MVTHLLLALTFAQASDSLVVPPLPVVVEPPVVTVASPAVPTLPPAPALAPAPALVRDSLPVRTSQAPTAPAPAPAAGASLPTASALPPLEGVDDPDLGPYLRHAWGLGFRLLGEAPQIMVRYALSDRMATGLDVAWFGQILTSAGRSRRMETPKPTTTNPGNIDSSRIDLQVALPLEHAFARRGPLSGMASIGPFARLQRTELEMDESIYTGDAITYRENRTEIHVGLQLALGARWEIAPDVVLASEFGLRGWGITGDYDWSTDYPEDLGYTDYSETGDLSGMGSSAWFGGIGLDVWF